MSDNDRSRASRTSGSENDSFGGAWLVTEYVYDPDGTYRGIVAQRRIVEPAGENRLRVIQHCDPSPELADHSMAAFAGQWVFDLEVIGAERRYLGPDVVGTATEWQPGAITGQGVWPRFGYEFESYSVLVAPDRQLTGGFFSLAGRSVVDIIGVAVPESSGLKPHLDLSTPPPHPSDEWPLHRTIGPMLIATAHPTPTHHRRLWAMHDPLTPTTLTLTQDTTNNHHSVSVTIG